jgi:hypothetical protein
VLIVIICFRTDTRDFKFHVSTKLLYFICIFKSNWLKRVLLLSTLLFTHIAQFCCGCAADPVSRFRLTVGTMSLLIPVVVVFQCIRAFGLLQAEDVWGPIKSFDITCVCVRERCEA